MDQAMRGARLLDAGCGTGNRTIMAAKTLGVSRMVGLDLSPTSLAVAARVAREEEFSAFSPMRGSVLDVPFRDGSFDIVVSWGVLHHTPDPRRGLREMIRVCRPGGLVAVFLYNKWNHWRHNLQKRRVTRLAGDDVERRFQIAHRLYGRKPMAEMTPEEIAVFYDQYCHPHKSDHTIGETLDWFELEGLTYWGSYPPLRVRDLVSVLQFRSRLVSTHPLLGRLTQLIVPAAARLPRVDQLGPPFARPSLLNRALWASLYAWQGRRGDYSGGAALAARKP